MSDNNKVLVVEDGNNKQDVDVEVSESQQTTNPLFQFRNQHTGSTNNLALDDGSSARASERSLASAPPISMIRHHNLHDIDDKFLDEYLWNRVSQRMDTMIADTISQSEPGRRGSAIPPLSAFALPGGVTEGPGRKSDFESTYSPSHRPLRDKLSRYVLLAVGSIVVISALSIGFAVFVDRIGVSQQQENHVSENHENDIRNPHDIRFTLYGLEAIRQKLLPISGDALFDVSSHQFRALEWMARNNETLLNTFLGDQNKTDTADDAALLLASTLLEETYIISLLYLSTRGNEWHDPDTNVSHHSDVFMNPSIPVCEWNMPNANRGVYCDVSESNIIKIDLSHYNLHGTIPFELGHLSLLRVLDLNDNSLVGTVPSELGSLSHIRKFNFRRNNLHGTIPSELGMMGKENGEYLLFSLAVNKLSGTIPIELGNLPAAQLALRNNRLHGTIPTTLFTGSNGLPNPIQSLELSYNRLTGSIPTEVGLLSSSLQSLSLNNNRLHGKIPTEIGSLNSSQFEILHLHENELNGHIPFQLRRLHSLTLITLQNNHLVGNITAIFCDEALISSSTFPNLSVVGADHGGCENSNNTNNATGRNASHLTCSCCCCGEDCAVTSR